MSPSPKIDIFARREREGWDAWGDEIDITNKLIAQGMLGI